MSLPTPTDADIRRIVDLVVAEVNPLRIVLFGSAARDEQRAGSDLDLLVVVSDETDVRACERQLYGMRRSGIRASVDFVVTTPAVLALHRNDVGYVYRRALLDGRELYAA